MKDNVMPSELTQWICELLVQFGNILQGTVLISSSLIKESLSYIDELHFSRCYIGFLLLLQFKLHVTLQTYQKRRNNIMAFKCALPLSSPTGPDVMSVENNIK